MCATEKTFILALQLAIISNCISLNRLLLKILDIAFGVEVGFLAGNSRGVEEHPGVVFHVNIAIELMSMQLFSVNLPIAVGMIFGRLTRVRRRWKEHPCFIIISHILFHFSISAQHIVEVKQLERHGNHHGELADSSQARRLIVDLLFLLIKFSDILFIPLHFHNIRGLKFLFTLALVTNQACIRSYFSMLASLKAFSIWILSCQRSLFWSLGWPKVLYLYKPKSSSFSYLVKFKLFKCFTISSWKR